MAPCVPSGQSRRSLTIEDVNGANDDARLRGLSDKYPGVPKVLFAVCARFREASTDQTPLDKDRLNLLMVTLKFMFYEIFVIARERKESLEHLQKILERLDGEGGSRAVVCGAGVCEAVVCGGRP